MVSHCKKSRFESYCALHVHFLLTAMLLDKTWQGADVVAGQLSGHRPVLVLARVREHRAHQGDAGGEEGQRDADQGPLGLLRGELPLPPVHDVHPQPPDVLLALLQVGHGAPAVRHLVVQRPKAGQLGELGEAGELDAGAEVGGDVHQGAGHAPHQGHLGTVGAGHRGGVEEGERGRGSCRWLLHLVRSGQDERVQERLTKCLDDELLADLVEPIPVTFQPGTVSIVRCRWIGKLDRELKVALGLWSGLPAEIRSE